MRIAVTVVLLTAMTVGPALAKTEQAKAKPEKPAATTAAKPSTEQLAAQGDAQAQLQLGQALLNGKGAKKNVAAAVSWLALAAVNGEVAAATTLADVYDQGQGVKKDQAQAARWLLLAGKMGDEDSKARFVRTFLAGDLDDIGGATGAEWVAAVANNGDVEAVLALGRAYEMGLGVPVDLARARNWYLRAAYGRDAEAQYRLGVMLLSEAGGWRLIFTNPEDEARNDQRGVYYPTRDAARAAAKGNQISDIVRPGMVEAEQWLRAAADQDHAAAQYALGKAYLGGLDLPFDLLEAVRWLSAAAFNGNSDAMQDLAALAADGTGFFGKDPLRAWVNYDLAAGQGVKTAEAGRDAVAKDLNARQLARARQISQDLRGN